jgi:hypothetical protein
MPLRPKPLPPVEELRALFRYDPKTGAIYSLTSNTSRRAGERCDGVRGGYRKVYVAPRLLTAHRVAWKLFYGEDPLLYIDHINGDGTDNRISNLRVGTHVQNMCNRSAAAHSRTGIKGVHYRGGGKWRAYLVAGGKRVNLGQFTSLEEASSAVSSARRAAHGEFASD